MKWTNTLLMTIIAAGFVLQVQSRVKVSFRLVSYENTGHIELAGGCCDRVLFSCGSSCDNRFNLCFDVFGGDNDMANCPYGNFQTDRLYENNDNFNFPTSLSSTLVNPIIFTITSQSTGLFRSKIEVWDYDPGNADDKIDYYGNNYNFAIGRTSALATEHTVTLNGAGESITRVSIKVYCDVHYYGTSSGCNTLCIARDDNEGHYDCNDITGDRMCHPGWTGSFCNQEINECDSDPCQFNAACTDLLADYRCNCPPGTQGKNCDDIDECSSDPCEHGGTCENELNHYQCHCLREYSGTNCEFEVDFCQSGPCTNGATCLGENDNGVLECVCAPGYQGGFCEQDIDECIGVECLNNGTCQNGLNQFTCNCTEGYAGQFCEMDIRNECESNPCQNNASCVDQVAGYVCVCLDGFQSDHCEENINECDPNPCSYGNCTDKIDRYTCGCWPGYSGENCTVDIDECVDSMCENGATCDDEVNGYTCTCIDGYTGFYCETEINECESSPCQNNGRCEDNLNSYTCQCSSTGYVGRVCDVDIDECLNEGACPTDKICVNVNGSYHCELIPMGSTPAPGLCRTSICYNNGTCQLINGTYQCVCTADFSGELCETPTEPCQSAPCLNGGTCQVQTRENGSVYYSCQCPVDYQGDTCQFYSQTQIGNEGGGFTQWYFVLIAIIFIIIIVGAGICFYKIHRDRRSKLVDDVPIVFSNPHTDSISIPTAQGATAAPPLPPKGKLEDDDDPNLNMTFTNNLYSDIDGPEVRGAAAVQSPNPKADVENPYAVGGYVHMNGHAASAHENHYEFARDPDVTDARPVKENDYSSDPTISKDAKKSFNLDNSYSTTIFPDTEMSRPISTNIPPPLPKRDNSTRVVPPEYDVPQLKPSSSTRVVPSEYDVPNSQRNNSTDGTKNVPYGYDVPRTPSNEVTPSPFGVDPPYSFSIYQQKSEPAGHTEALTPRSPGNPFNAEMPSEDEQRSTPTSIPSSPSSPINPYSTTLTLEGNQSVA